MLQNTLALLSSQEHFNIETDTDEIKLSKYQNSLRLGTRLRRYLLEFQCWGLKKSQAIKLVQRFQICSV